MPQLKITVSDETLPADIVLVIDHGDGFEDNAKRLGWQSEIPLDQSVLDDAARKVLDQADGSKERLEAQAALLELRNKTQPNPESALMFLVVHIRKLIDQVLIDPDEANRKQQDALAKIQEEIDASLDARRQIEFVPKTPAV